jgi:hypothetical protein
MKGEKAGRLSQYLMLSLIIGRKRLFRLALPELYQRLL